MSLVDQLIGSKAIVTEAMEAQDWIHAIKGLGPEGLDKGLKTLTKGKLKKLYAACKGESAPAEEGGEEKEEKEEEGDSKDESAVTESISDVAALKSHLTELAEHADVMVSEATDEVQRAKLAEVKADLAAAASRL